MLTRTVTVASTTGLHARPAMLVTQAAATAAARVTIARPGQAPVDASSILLVMGLGVQHGEEIEVASEDAQALDILAGVIATDLDAR